MRLLIWILGSFLFVSPALGQGALDSGTPVQRLVIASDIMVTVSASAQEELRPASNLGTLDHFVFEREGNSLSVSRDQAQDPPADPIELFLTLPNLVDIDASSGAHVIISDVETATFTIRSTTGGFVEARNFDIGTLSVRASTGGDVKTDGQCGSLDANADRGGVIHADHLRCGSVVAEATDGALLRTFAIDEANIIAKRGATLVLSGTAKVTSKVQESWAVMRVWAKPLGDAG